uniref:PARP-type domain-containing protein n=1 Tax=Pavo cristatus TaxID=9049 RepID=A0A8C9FTU7_PAVCR
MDARGYCVDYAKRGTAGCKKCKEKIVKGMVRIGKIVPNPFTESGGDMKEWYHVKCMFENNIRGEELGRRTGSTENVNLWESRLSSVANRLNCSVIDCFG